MKIKYLFLPAVAIASAPSFYFSARIRAYRDLQIQLNGMQKVIKKLEAIYAVAGHTMGGIRAAGKEIEHDQLWEEGGKHYRKAVKASAFLMYWPIGVLFFKRPMLKAYNKVGLFSGCKGSYQAYEDVCHGFAENTHYYPCDHLKGLAASLGVARLLI
jgi:hypothetical protein